MVDPWNDIAQDHQAADFHDAMLRLKDCLSHAANPACLIVHHFRKPKDENRIKGRSQAFHAAGSYVIVSKARCVIGMNPASDDPVDQQVVVTVSKNNDGEHGPNSAWTRHAGWFEPVLDFDWDFFVSILGFDLQISSNRSCMRKRFEETSVKQVIVFSFC